jgi:hypothetical protein
MSERCGYCGGFGTKVMGLDPYWPCWACNGTGWVPRKTVREVCMKDDTHVVNGHVYEEPCLHPLPCPRHSHG